MKKLLSIFLAVMMMTAVATANAVPSFAAWFSSIESADKDIVINITVDGQDSIHGEYNHINKDEASGGHFPVIDFVYKGDKDILHWEVIDLEEGKDYNIIKQEDKLLQLEIINPTITEVLVNVVTTDSENAGNGEVVSRVDEPTTSTVKNPDKSLTSPNTGAGVMTASAVATGVGVALLGATRKRK